MVITDTLIHAWPMLEGCSIKPAPSGLLNNSFIVNTAFDRFVLQRVNKIFQPSVHNDIFSVTQHLKARGLITPSLIPTNTGELYLLDKDTEQEACYRLLTYIEGQSFDFVSDPVMASEAGRIVAQFHKALSDFEYSYQHKRFGVHDLDVYKNQLLEALKKHPYHNSYDVVAYKSEELLEYVYRMPLFDELPLRHAHGDLKISNILFSNRRAQCLIDLDTLARLPWPIEMGDALRSWCNPFGEDTVQTQFEVDLFVGALKGYAGVLKNDIKSIEKEYLVTGIERVALELSIRFFADALNENYFGYDAARYHTRSAHNLVRANGQLNLLKLVKNNKIELEKITQHFFG